MPEFLQKMRVPSRYRGAVLILVVMIASILLGSLNYLNNKTTAAIRAYLHGESHYSKGQKDATHNLLLYVVREEALYYEQFKEDILIPIGDSIARVGLLNNADEELIRQGFLQGNNHPDNVDQLIWLFKNFQDHSLLKKPIEIWKDGDREIGNLMILAEQIHADVQSGHLTEHDRNRYLDQIGEFNEEFTRYQRTFSEKLRAGAKKITSLFILVNTALIVIIMGIVALLIHATIRALQISRKELKAKNRGLVETNKKLDSFIYASSHDLKSPISNLEGLLQIFTIRNEVKDPEQLSLLDKMKTSVDKLKLTIANIENLIRLDRESTTDVVENDFQELLDQILEENEMSFLTEPSEITTDFQVKSIPYSKLALKSVMYNLVSNAIKYQSPKRKLHLKLSTYTQDGRVVLEVADNGLGIDMERHGDKLFVMFKRFHQHNTGSGLGLYAVKQMVEKNGGKITVESEVDKGTTFYIVF